MAASAKSKIRVIKLQDFETVRFLELYSKERALFDPTLEDYKDRGKRMAAASRIANALKIPGFGPNEVIAKFRNLRSWYCQELKKLTESQRSGADDYKPKIYWFDLMNSFIRPFIQNRSTQANFALSINPSELSQSPGYQGSGEDFYDTSISWTPSIKSEPVSPRRTYDKREMHSDLQESSSPKIIKVFQNSKADFMPRPFELQEVPDPIVADVKEDCYDCFGKYVASMLRSIGSPKAFRLQETITSIIINEMCPPTSPSNR